MRGGLPTSHAQPLCATWTRRPGVLSWIEQLHKFEQSWEGEMETPFYYDLTSPSLLNACTRTGVLHACTPVLEYEWMAPHAVAYTMPGDRWRQELDLPPVQVLWNVNMFLVS
jgi:hypothetical protein